MNSEEDLHCRVVIIGDSSVGKTSILNRFIENSFNPCEYATIGANYQIIYKTFQDHKIELQIWDTAGQEKFRSLSPIYFRKATGAIAVFDLTNQQSFDNLPSWINLFTDIAGVDNIVAVAGNKSDLKGSYDVNLDKAREFCKDNNYIFKETSAQSGAGIAEFFEEFTTAVFLKTLHNSAPAEVKPIKNGDENSNCC
jgi:small GTP-binding protein